MPPRLLGDLIDGYLEISSSTPNRAAISGALAGGSTSGGGGVSALAGSLIAQISSSKPLGDQAAELMARIVHCSG